MKLDPGKFEQDKQIVKSILNEIFISDISDIITELVFEMQVFFYGTTTAYENEIIHLLEIDFYAKYMTIKYYSNDQDMCAYFYVGSIPVVVSLSTISFISFSHWSFDNFPSLRSGYTEISIDNVHLLKNLLDKYYPVIYELSRVNFDSLSSFRF
jgi:hypothetical protein